MHFRPTLHSFSFLPMFLINSPSLPRVAGAAHVYLSPLGAFNWLIQISFMLTYTMVCFLNIICAWMSPFFMITISESSLQTHFPLLPFNGSCTPVRSTLYMLDSTISFIFAPRYQQLEWHLYLPVAYVTKLTFN